MPSSQEALQDAIKKGEFSNPNATIHMGSHIADYSDDVIEKMLDIRIEYDNLINQVGKAKASEIIILKLENFAQNTKVGLLNGNIKLN